MNVNMPLFFRLAAAFLFLINLISALCWLADSALPHDVLINGLKRGVGPKHRYDPRFRSMRRSCVVLVKNLHLLPQPSMFENILFSTVHADIVNTWVTDRIVSISRITMFDPSPDLWVHYSFILPQRRYIHVL
jgi:hypothetical protein